MIQQKQLRASNSEAVNGCEKSVKESFGLFREFCKRHWRNFKQHLRLYFNNQVDLMLNIIPYWARFLNQYSAQAYGHFRFLGPECDKLVVNLQIIESSKIKTPILRRKITQFFESCGLQVANIRINVLTSEQQKESYHQYHLHRPLHNQHYQVFLTALEDAHNWEVYVDQTDLWEIAYYLHRYFNTHIQEMFRGKKDTAKDVTEYTDENKNTFQIDHWTYLIEPFFDFGWTVAQIRKLILAATDDLQDKYPDEYCLIAKLVGHAYLEKFDNCMERALEAYDWDDRRLVQDSIPGTLQRMVLCY